MNRWILTTLLLGFGCDGGTATEAEADTDTDADSDADTDTDFELSITPASFGVGLAEFAIDDQGRAVSFSGFDQAGNPIDAQVSVTVLILDVSATTTIDESNSCQITFGLPGPVDPAPWVATAGVYWGFTIPAGSPVLGNTCQDYVFPAEWGDVVTPVSQWDWGFGLNVMDPSVESQLAQALGANWASIEDSVVGAGWYSNALVQGGDPTGFADGGFALGSEVDSTFTLQFDGAGNPIQMASDDVWFPGATLPGVGAYIGNAIFYIQPAEALLAAPQ